MNYIFIYIVIRKQFQWKGLVYWFSNSEYFGHHQVNSINFHRTGFYSGSNSDASQMKPEICIKLSLPDKLQNFWGRVMTAISERQGRNGKDPTAIAGAADS